MAYQIDDDRKREIPPLLRASTDETDAAGFALLRKNDAEQMRLAAENLTVPANNPKTRAISNARILIETLENARTVQPLTVEQNEQLAESYAACGFYNKAAETSRDASKIEIYLKYWNAVWLDDAHWCVHAENHKYIKETVFSVKDNMLRSLLACNVCGEWNVMDAPEKLVDDSRRRANVRQMTKGMNMAETKEFLERNFRR